MASTMETVRWMRLEATRLYWSKQFEEFKKLSRAANRMEHDYKMQNQPEVGK